MDRTIVIRVGGIVLEAILYDSNTANTIWDVLPIKAHINTWGDEIYFAIPVGLELEQGQDIVNRGDLGFWPVGKAFCIFFGPTPMSSDNEIRPASSVNVFGRILGDATVLKGISSGAEVFVEKKETK
ncbi:cyclophilin-like fold protein [Chloroflexota bacterium]